VQSHSVSQKSNKKSVNQEHNEGGQKYLIVAKRVVGADYIGLEGCGEHLSFK